MVNLTAFFMRGPRQIDESADRTQTGRFHILRLLSMIARITSASAKDCAMPAPLKRLLFFALAVLCMIAAPAHADSINDYPTAARADYIFGCMKANGETRQVLDQCSCSVDVVASLLPYDRYVTAETVLRMVQVQGDLGGPFRSSEQATTALNDLRRAQAEAEVRCF
jgi:hypothetical protein